MSKTLANRSMSLRFAALLLVALACSKVRKAPPMSVAATAEAPSAVSRAATQNAAPNAAPSPSPQAVARMIIRNANMSIVVRDATDVLNKVTALVDSKGGYVAESKRWKESEQVRASARLRVPAVQLSPTLAAIRGLAVRVESESVTAEDVSQEYTDLDAQLRNLQATETELRELLKTVRERMQKASEIMEVFNEITKVRGEIDRIQGRMKYLSQMTSLSTITLELIPDVLAAPVVEPGWQPVATAKAASRSLINSMKTVIDALIWIVLYLVPLGIVVAAFALVIRAGWLAIRRLRAH